MKTKLTKNSDLCPLTFFTVEEKVKGEVNTRCFDKSNKHKTHAYLLNTFYKPISSFKIQ